MTIWKQVRDRHIALMRTSIVIIGNVVYSTSDEEAYTYRDDGTGWTVTEVLCHLRDYDDIFMSRAIMIVRQDRPHLPAFDHNQLAIDGEYNAQDKDVVYRDFAAHRERFAQWFEQLDEEQWLCEGIHPERDYLFSLTDALMQVTSHDANHIEQMTRIILERRY